MGMGGTQRSAKFVKYLPLFNWDPIVVTVKEVHYYAHDNSLLKEMSSCKIIRTESYDPLRLFARLKKVTSTNQKVFKSPTQKRNSKLLNWGKRFIMGWLFIPDSKIFWLPFALKSSLLIIRKQKVKIIFTTSPPHSAHLGGLLLKIMSGVPWVADFRDDWTGGESQPSPTIFHTFVNRILEKLVLKLSDRIIGMCDNLTKNLMRKIGYSSQYDKLLTIMNGYDREDLVGLENLAPNSRFTITHCGAISHVSNPEPFLKAVHELVNQQPQLKNQIMIQFLGTDLYGHLAKLVQTLRLNQIIAPIQYLPHRAALKEMMRSHLLLLTIFRKTDEEIITGKLFEYLASGKPILLISSEGEVARMIRTLRRGDVINNNNILGISNAILNYFQKWKEGNLKFNDPVSLPQFDRKNLTGRLAGVFEELDSFRVHG